MTVEDPVPSAAPDGGRATPLSLRTRLTLWVVAIFSLIHFVTTGVYWLYQSAAASRDFDSHLVERSEEVAREIAPSVPGLDDTLLEIVANRVLLAGRLGNLRVGVFDRSGQSVVPEANMPRPPEGIAWEQALGGARPRVAHLDIDALERPDPASRSARTVARGFVGRDGERYVLVMMLGDASAYRELASAGQSLVLAAVVGLLAAAVAGWFIAGIAVAPFDRLRAVARHLRPEALGDKIELGHSSAEVEQLTRELEDVRSRLAAAFAAQERFLSNVTHEIKTPIAVLLVEAQTLQSEDLPEAAAEFVRSAEYEMTRLGKLVEAFLMLTRLRDSRGLINTLSCGVNDLVMDSVEDCQLMAEQHGVHLRPVLLEDEETIDTEVRGDRELLITMLNNLIRNAIRFSSPTQTVAVDVARDDSSVLIAVLDEGPGIPPDRLATIFDRFAQAPEEQRRGRGHGLGLAIAQGIAELHGGEIEAANRDEGGCSFTVELPVRTALTRKAGAAEPQSVAADPGR